MMRVAPDYLRQDAAARRLAACLREVPDAALASLYATARGAAKMAIDYERARRRAFTICVKSPVAAAVAALIGDPMR